jgi:hypothetical protein
MAMLDAPIETKRQQELRRIARAYLPKQHHSWGHGCPSFSRITDGKSTLHGAAQHSPRR